MLCCFVGAVAVAVTNVWTRTWAEAEPMMMQVYVHGPPGLVASREASEGPCRSVQKRP